MKQLPVIKNKLVKLPPAPPNVAPQDADFRVLSESDDEPKAQTRIVFNKVLASRDMAAFIIGFVLGAMLIGSFYIEHKETHNCQAVHGKR